MFCGEEMNNLFKISAALLIFMGCSSETPQTHKVGVMYNITGDQAPIENPVKNIVKLKAIM